jgi:hypothetical protein
MEFIGNQQSLLLAALLIECERERGGVSRVYETFFGPNKKNDFPDVSCTLGAPGILGE